MVTVGGHTYRSTVAPMGSAFWIPLSGEHREAAGVQAGDEVGVVVAPSHRKEWVRWVEETKKPETRQARIGKPVESLRAGRKTR